MFRAASKQASAHQAELIDALSQQIDGLGRTAQNWFDETSASVAGRQSQLRAVAGLCYRVAGVNDDIDGSDLTALGDEFNRQASELEDTRRHLASEEYEANVGTAAPRFSSPLGDESRLAARRSGTDWDLFMSIEPREFVASNEHAIGDSEEMRRRAFNFMVDATSGYGFNRTAKENLSAQFIDKVEQVRTKLANKKTAAAPESDISFEDSALYF